jgi:hypothetical protein
MTNDFKRLLNVPVSKEKLYNAIHTQEDVRNWWTTLRRPAKKFAAFQNSTFQQQDFM